MAKVQHSYFVTTWSESNLVVQNVLYENKRNWAFPDSPIWHFEELPLYTKPQNAFSLRPKKKHAYIQVSWRVTTQEVAFGEK